MKTKVGPKADEAAKMERLSTTMDGPTLEALKKFSKISGMPIAEAIRRAVREFLAAQAKKL